MNRTNRRISTLKVGEIVLCKVDDTRMSMWMEFICVTTGMESLKIQLF